MTRTCGKLVPKRGWCVNRTNPESRGQGNFSERPECHSKTEAAEPASLQDRSRGAGALRNSHWTKAATTYVNMFEVTCYRQHSGGEVTDGTHVTAGQLALALTPYAQVTDLAVNTAAAGDNAAAIQSLDDLPRRRPWPPRTARWPRTEAASPRCRAR